MHVLPIAEEAPPSIATTEEETFSMQDVFLPAARLALKENLEKQGMKVCRIGKNCKLSSFGKDV